MGEGVTHISGGIGGIQKPDGWVILHVDQIGGFGEGGISWTIDECAGGEGGGDGENGAGQSRKRRVGGARGGCVLGGGFGEGVQVGSMVMRETGVAGRLAGDEVEAGGGVEAGAQATNKNNTGSTEKIRTATRGKDKS
jgi:hypothetical protein